MVLGVSYGGNVDILCRKSDYNPYSLGSVLLFNKPLHWWGIG